MRLRQIVFAVSLGVCLSNAVHGEPPPDAGARVRARELLREGNDMLDRGFYVQAHKLFEEAYRTFASPKLHFNIAQALYQLGRPLEALERYERFVREINKEEHLTEWRLAQERVFELQAQIATVDIQCNVVGALVTLDGREAGRTPLPRSVRVTPGVRTLALSKPGYERQVIEITFKAGDNVTQRVKLLTEAESLGSRQTALSATGAPGTAGSGAAHDLPPAVLFARLAPSVVVVDVHIPGRRAQGSGIVIGRERIVTNHHVIDGATAIQITHGGRRFAARIAQFDAAHDLAILSVPGLDQPRVIQRPSSLVQVGERVYAIGAPRGLELSLSDGLIAALRTENSGSASEPGATILQTTAAISPGSSGGGLFDAQGRLVGITTFSAINGQSLNFALPTEWIAALEKNIAPGARPAPPAAVSHYSVTDRPEVLLCGMSTQSTWGVFTGGAELLETRTVRETWQFERVDTQLPRLVAPQSPAMYGTIELVLADFDRGARFVRFGRADRSIQMEYFFTVDEAGAFQVTSLSPINFHGQLRVLTTSGPCEMLTMANLTARRIREAGLAQEREVALRNAERAQQEQRAVNQVETQRRERQRVLPIAVPLMVIGAVGTVTGIGLAAAGYGRKDGDLGGTLDRYLGSFTTINAQRGIGVTLANISIAAVVAGAVTMGRPPRIGRRNKQAIMTILPARGGMFAEGSSW
jgi:S1-C subfamily serine protease